MQDGNIHCHIDNLSRRDGKHGARIAVASAAYVAGQRLWSDVEQRIVEFSMREDVVFSEIIVPEAAPAWAADRAALWNRVDLSALRKDARLAKTIVAAVTREIPSSLRIELLRAFAAPFVDLGCVADVAIHEDGTDHNPHMHLLLTTRRLTANGFGQKLTALEQRSFVKQVRQRWAALSNHFLEKAGSTVRVDHRSYRARGIEAEPTVHRGPNVLERRDKREHARRVREERTMSKPDPYEQRDYPHLAARETWPPEPAPSPDMTRQERDEHHRYLQDRKIDKLEAQYQSEPDKPWYQQALERAQAESGRDPFAPVSGTPRLRAQDRDEALAAYDRSVLERAKAMDRSHAEADALDAVRDAPEDIRRFVRDFILQERIQAVREGDLADQLRRVPSHFREKLEALRDSSRERDLPEPSPNRELISRLEHDRAQEQILAAYERDEPDRDERER